MKPTLLFQFITYTSTIIHIVLSIPLLSTFITISTDWIILIILILLHIVAGAINFTTLQKVSPSHIVGFICSLLGFIPIIDFLFHIVAALFGLGSILVFNPELTNVRFSGSNTTQNNTHNKNKNTQNTSHTSKKTQKTESIEVEVVKKVD